MHNYLIKIIVAIGIVSSIALAAKVIVVEAQDLNPENAEVAIEIDLPALGESANGPTQPFSEGTFSVEKVAYLKGMYASAGVTKQFLKPEDTVFKYGDNYLTVSPGDNYVTVVICKTDFTEGLPAIPNSFNKWDQMQARYENGMELMGVKSYSDIGATRYYIIGATSNREWGNKIKIYFFSTQDLGKN